MISLYSMVVVLLLFQYGHCGWKNSYDNELHFQCPIGRGISYMESEHNNYYGDRRWDFRCWTVPGTQHNCQWSNYVNNFDATFTYQCPGTGYVTGIISYHNNYYADRRHKFRCCESTGRHIDSCYNTNYNEWDGRIKQHIPYGYVWRGVTSHHNNYYGDRQFSFTFCRIN